MGGLFLIFYLTSDKKHVIIFLFQEEQMKPASYYYDLSNSYWKTGKFSNFISDLENKIRERSNSGFYNLEIDITDIGEDIISYFTEEAESLGYFISIIRTVDLASYCTKKYLVVTWGLLNELTN